MERKSRLVLLLGISAAIASSSAFAHHSFAMFDQTQCLKLTGTVRAYEFHYPHTWLWLAVEDSNHKMTIWGMQGASPPMMAQQGFTEDAFKVGDKITVVYNPLKDGRKGGSLQQAILGNGQVLKGVGDYQSCDKPNGASDKTAPSKTATYSDIFGNSRVNPATPPAPHQ